MRRCVCGIAESEKHCRHHAGVSVSVEAAAYCSSSALHPACTFTSPTQILASHDAPPCRQAPLRFLVAHGWTRAGGAGLPVSYELWSSWFRPEAVRLRANARISRKPLQALGWRSREPMRRQSGLVFSSGVWRMRSACMRDLWLGRRSRDGVCGSLYGR